MSTFAFKQFKVMQSPTVFKIGTESCAFAASVSIDNEIHSALEVGSGTGVISLMLAQRLPSCEIHSIDINKEAHALSMSNYAQSPWPDRLSSFHSGFAEWKSPSRYDLIVSNPPFFLGSLLPNNNTDRLAKHLLDFKHVDLLLFAEGLLNPRGSCWVLLPEKEAQDLLKTNTSKLRLSELITLKKYSKSGVFRYMMGFSLVEKASNQVMERELTIYEHTTKYTSAFSELLRPFYINL